MTLDDLRKKVIYQNTLDVWISACEESKINWNEAENYKKFIEFLQNQNINMKKFPLCVSESDNSSPEKVSFAEHLSESKDPSHETFTIKLSDSTIDKIRKFDFKN
ncbi:MAG: hypothetical protein PVH93_05695 [Nitrosopumilaceae archaeon]|jgi:hypothetical protein